MSKQCPKCQKEYQDSMNFCLDDGAVLSINSDAVTLEMQTLVRQPKEPEDAEKRIQSILEELYTDIDFAPFEFDARFERLIKRYRNDSFEKVYEFLGKLYGRMKLAERRNEGNYDPTALSIAISEVTPGEADEVLRKHGLI